MKYSTVEYKKFASKRRFGVELEVGCTVSKAKIHSAIKEITKHPVIITQYQPSIDNDYWHVKSDATCGPKGRNGPKGIEIASFVGKGETDLQHICNVASHLSRLGCKVNQNCGLHIHADAVDLTKHQVGTLWAYWFKLEIGLQYALPLHRIKNDYCRMMMDRYMLPSFLPLLKSPWMGESTPAENLYCLLSPSDIGYYDNQDRRVNFNIVNYSRACYYKVNTRKTLELRWPEGTLNSDDIKNWTRLFLSFIDSCKDRPFPKDTTSCTLSEVLDLFGLEHSADVFSIFSEELFEAKTWLLERFMKQSSFFKDEAMNLLNLMHMPVRKYA